MNFQNQSRKARIDGLQRSGDDPIPARVSVAERQARLLALSNPDIVRNQHGGFMTPKEPRKTKARKTNPRKTTPRRK